jgi:hypothetical protein
VAGNDVTAGPFVFMIDRLAPAVERHAASDSCSLPGDDDWCRGTQSAGFTTADGGSGLAAHGVASRSFTRSNSGEGGAVMISSGAVADMVGNENPGIEAGPFKIDSGEPAVACAFSAPVFTLGEVGAIVSAGVTDAISGASSASVSAPADTSTVGQRAVNLTGSDKAGNSKTVSCPYRGVYSFHGFFAPVDNSTASSQVWNVAKAGSAIPVKFDLGGYQGLAILTSSSPSSIQVACPNTALYDAVEETLAVSTSGLSFDARANAPYGQYVYVWKTGSWAGTCRKLTVTLADGSAHFAYFKFAK